MPQCTTQHAHMLCKTTEKLDVSKLKSLTVQQQLPKKRKTIFGEDIETAPDADTEWARLRDTLYGATHEILCVTQRKQRDWFDENDTEAMTILDNMNISHIAWINDKNSKEYNMLSPLQAASTGQATCYEGGLVV